MRKTFFEAVISRFLIHRKDPDVLMKKGSPSQGSEHHRMIRRYFAEATFPSTLRYKPVSEPVFKNLKPV